MCSSGSFVRIPREEWQFADGLEDDRRQRLNDGPLYTEIIHRIVSEAVVRFHARRRCCSDHEYFRVEVTLELSSEIVDLFHNSAGGYRAQYYRSASLGDQANAYALRRIVPRIVGLLSQAKRTCPESWVRLSLLDNAAKLWIHQGLWLRHAQRTDRQLRVDRWDYRRPGLNPTHRKRALMAALLPAHETLLDIKGGFLHAQTGISLRSLKPTRAGDIHAFGFT